MDPTPLRRLGMKSASFSPAAAVFITVVGKTLVLVGVAIAAVGLVVMLGVPIGRLPGDFYVRRGSFTFYFPLATSIVVSILLTIVLALFRR